MFIACVGLIMFFLLLFFVVVYLVTTTKKLKERTLSSPHMQSNQMNYNGDVESDQPQHEECHWGCSGH